MSEGRIIFDGGIKTQSIDAVKGMIEFLTGEQVRELPAVVRLANGWHLTRSSKGDAYYMTSPRECSCPGYYYRRTCQHVKSLLDAEEAKGVLLLDAHAWEPTSGEIENQEMKALKKAQEQQQPHKEEQLSESQAFARRIVEAMEA
jgi:hypothetical protein